MMLCFLFCFVFFITLVPTTSRAGLATSFFSVSTLAVDLFIQPRRNHDYNDYDDYNDYNDNDYNDNDHNEHNDKDDGDDQDDGKWHGDDGNDDIDEEEEDDNNNSSSSYKSTSTKTSWSKDSSTTYVTLSESNGNTVPTLSIGPALVPSTTIASPSATLSPEKASLIASQVIKARQRALDASSSSTALTWLSPRSGDAFAAGNEISIRWSTQSASDSQFQLRLCILKSTADLNNAQSGFFGNGACGSAVDADSTLMSDGSAYQVSLGAPSVSTADSFFIVMIPSQAISSMPSNSQSDSNMQQRDTPFTSQMVSPAFVLAPNGFDLSAFSNLPSAPTPSPTSTSHPQQLQQQTDPTLRKRPVAWSWVVGPIIAVICIVVVCALVYSHRKGRRSARKAALQQARQGEEKWREVTRKEVDDLAESTISHASRLSYIAPQPQRFMSVVRKPVPQIDPSCYDDDPYTYHQSNLGRLKRQSQRSSTLRTSSSLVADRSSCASTRVCESDNEDPYSNLPSDLGELPRRPQRSSTIYSCSSSTSKPSSPSLCALSIRRVAPYDDQGRCRRWTSIVYGDDDSCSQTEVSDCDSQKTLVQQPIPAALLPRSETQTSMSNPHEVTRRPVSLPAVPPRPCHTQPVVRRLSFSAAEASTTTGRRGTAYDFINPRSMQQADHVNDLYLQLKQALQQPLHNTNDNPC